MTILTVWPNKSVISFHAIHELDYKVDASTLNHEEKGHCMSLANHLKAIQRQEEIM